MPRWMWNVQLLSVTAFVGPDGKCRKSSLQDVFQSPTSDTDGVAFTVQEVEVGNNDLQHTLLVSDALSYFIWRSGQIDHWWIYIVEKPGRRHVCVRTWTRTWFLGSCIRIIRRREGREIYSGSIVRNDLSAYGGTSFLQMVAWWCRATIYLSDTPSTLFLLSTFPTYKGISDLACFSKDMAGGTEWLLSSVLTGRPC